MDVWAYLQSNGFKTYFVSGGTESVRKIYEIDRAQFFGAPGKDCIWADDGEMPLNMIEVQSVGGYATAAFANSDEDFQMLKSRAPGGRDKRLVVLLCHTPADHHQSSFDRLNKAMAEANANGWTVVEMDTDWKPENHA